MASSCSESNFEEIRDTPWLAGLLAASAKDHNDRIAVEDANGHSLSYRDLDEFSNALADQLIGAGVAPNDRVGIYAPKSLSTFVSIFAVLKAGAAYVPVDPAAPPARNAFIFQNCLVRAVIVEQGRLAGFRAACADTPLSEAGAFGPTPGEDWSLAIVVPDWPDVAQRSDESASKDLAYILYTSGSTGKPKGVMHSHATARSFLDWCSKEFDPQPEDRFSSHAPFHFDLSILDIYLPIRHGARVVLIGEELGKQPQRLAPLIEEKALTVWYSTPSILRLLVEFGHLDAHCCDNLRLVLFAGEVFPVKHLRALQGCWPKPRYCNLYGPTETNVCTWFEAPHDIPPDRVEPLPIGYACSGDRTLVVDENDRAVPPGEDGELLVAGGSVMLGYWNLPEQNARAFLVDADDERWYRTGDVVREEAGQCYMYLGRRDRMVKRRGFRVELGEIESVLYRNPDITEVAVIAKSDDDSGVHLRAFVSWAGADRPSQIALKRFAAENLPGYMIPDRFIVLDALPRTSTDKTDYQALKAID